MATRENNPVPKNYITSGINKKLLTPCRRIGLSRSKKTPKNVYVSPLTQVPKIVAKTTPVRNIELFSDADKNNDFSETPKKLPTPRKIKKYITRVAVETENIVINDVKRSSFSEEIHKDSISNETVAIKNKTSTLKDSSRQNNTAVQTLVTAKVHHSAAKRSINFNNIISPSLSNTIKEQNSDVNINPLIVTPSTAENTTSLEQVKEKSFEVLVVKNKKLKSRLDSDNFSIDENQGEYKETPKNKISSYSSKKSSISRETVTLKNKISTLKESSSQNNVPVKILVTAEVHDSVGKRNINFNNMPSLIHSTKEQNPDVNINLPIFIPSTAENTTSLEQVEEKSFEVVGVKNKKRKLRLDSDDFSINENQAEYKDSPKTKISPYEDSLKTSISPQTNKIKKGHTTINEDCTGIALGRFTTEDYLKEYSSHPELFQESLETDDPRFDIFNDDEDMDAFCNLSNIRKPNQMKTTTRSSNQSKKGYVAIVCPSIDQSNKKPATPKHSISKKKSSLELKLSKQLLIPTKTKLTVSLERLTKENLKSNLKNYDSKDIQLEELQSTSEATSSIKNNYKRNQYNEDDELFTSSPENDRKQRENLLKLIVEIEHKIKEKEQKVEKLKQAQVYKKKHSPEQLKVSSDRWLEGCRAGLNELLVKMQEHGPMEMDILITKLRIPDEIVEKLKL